MIRQGLSKFLSDEPDMEVVGDANDGKTAIRLVKELHPDIVLMDISMPNLNGVEATRAIMAYSPGVKVLGLTMHSDSLVVLNMLKAGASGYLLKDCALEELKGAIRKVMDHKIYFSPGVSDRIINIFLKDANLPTDTLSPTEREVFQMIAEGNSIRKISETLGIPKKVIGSIFSRLKINLGVSTIDELMKLAFRQGLTSLTSEKDHQEGIPSKHVEKGVDKLNDNLINTISDFNKFKDIFGAAMHSLRNIMMFMRIKVNDYQEDVSLSNIDLQKSQHFCNFITNNILEINHILERLYYYIDIKKPSKDDIKSDNIFMLVSDLIKTISKPIISINLYVNNHFNNNILHIDEFQLVWVIEEIIFNSIKALEERGGKIDIRFNKINNKITVSINDNGPGIPAQIRKKLFIKQLPRTSKGLGLGLYLANQIIKDMGGKLELRTYLGKGTTTRIIIPISST